MAVSEKFAPAARGAVMMAEFCSIPTCGKQITSDRAEVHDKGLEGLLRASIEREDGLQSVFERKRSQLPVPVHAKCRREYIRPCSIASYKRKREEEPLDSDWGTSSSKLRSRTRVFNIKEDCLYCAKTVIDYNVETKIPRNRRVRAHDAMTKVTLQSVIEKAAAIAMMSGEMLLDFAYPMS
ncbi:hypothetical protein GWK47_011314 [Chionoecetes opilio]|uniref:Uncharacterized protein n=1 Tax=Chionoecetes opilio TaxID=41210 RepID=A0A8J4XXH8_CHIOP|nr:hypothetical protein GWK47_011314 [Chionoecetes opilio]